MSQIAPDMDTLSALYDYVELTILFDWLEWPRPPDLADIDLDQYWEPAPDPAVYEESAPPRDTEAGPIRLQRSYDGFGEYNTVANAAARLALQSIADRLPQWARVDEAGVVHFARAPITLRPSTIRLMPRFLIEINWADTAPGMSWPEAYHATYLPGFDVYVVTLSADSPEAYGYSDLAIGTFSAGESFDKSVRNVIYKWWTDCCPHDDPDSAWQYVVIGGEISEDEAKDMARQIWGTEEDDDEKISSESWNSLLPALSSGYLLSPASPHPR